MFTTLLFFLTLALGNVINYQDDLQCKDSCGQAITMMMQAPAAKATLLNECSNLLGTTIIPIKATATTTSTTTVINFNNNGAYNPTIVPLIKPNGTLTISATYIPTPTLNTCPEFDMKSVCHCAGVTPFVTTLKPAATAQVIAQIPSTISAFNLKANFPNGTSLTFFNYPSRGLSSGIWSSCVSVEEEGKFPATLLQLMPNSQLQNQAAGGLSWTNADLANYGGPSEIIYSYNVTQLQETTKMVFSPQLFHIEVAQLGDSWKYTLEADGPRTQLYICGNRLTASTAMWAMNNYHSSGCQGAVLEVIPKY